MSSKRLQIGKIGRPHGRFGEVRVHLHNDAVELLHPDIPLYTSEHDNQTLVVESVRPTTKCYLVSFQGYQYRDEVQELTNLALWVDRSDMPATDSDEYYCADLIGFRVVAKQPETDGPDIEIGHVTGFLDHVETDVMIIEGPRILKRWLVPFISTVVLHVGIDERLIVLAPLHQWTHEDQTLL